MKNFRTDVLVIGGGATGTGILRDLAMRGFKCCLVERRDLAYGTTGRYHGLLHSGARYVVKDPVAAKECFEENIILRRIMPHCLEDTGGYFVSTPNDDLSYITRFLDGCKSAAIPVENVPVHRMLKDEPYLDPKIQACFHVPDASADSFLAAELNCESAHQYGAQVFTYHEVIRLITSKQSPKDVTKVTGALCRDLVKDEDVQIDASFVINASGAWAGLIANMVGIPLQMVPGKGTMVALNHRMVNTVINRCKMPSDGDILVPAHSVAIIGTTDIQVSNPDRYTIEPWEIRLMLDEGEKIIPLFKQFRVLRAWAGVRPLIQGTSVDSNRDISRSFVLIDHSLNNGVDGIITITSGKWTTYRKMAQATVDKICEKLDTHRPCRTHIETLPLKHEVSKSPHYLGSRLLKIEQEKTYGDLVCECELVTRVEIEKSIIQSNPVTIDDIRRDSRLGMGPCQGAFCTFRAAGIMHELRHPTAEETNAQVVDFLEERWKGNLPVFWGQGLRQERFTELIYLSNLNIKNLPGKADLRFSSPGYIKSTEIEVQKNNLSTTIHAIPRTSIDNHDTDVVVIGAGLSGLFTAYLLSSAGIKTKIITKGWGTNYWSTGCVDVLGYLPSDFNQCVDSPINCLDDLIDKYPTHPYSLVGKDKITNAIHLFKSLCKEMGYPYFGSLDRNIIIPTALGSIRPTCLVPISMVAGDVSQSSPMLIVGFDSYNDFYPSLVSDNLNAQGILARGISLDLKSLRNNKVVTNMVFARCFDDYEFRQELIGAIKPRLGNSSRIGFPAVLGLKNTPEVINHLETSLGLPIFEIPGLPPSIPGIRLHNMLVSAIEKNQGVVYEGMQVVSTNSENNLVTSVNSDAAARTISHIAKNYVLATGGILGGGISTNIDGYAQDTVFNLPVLVPASRSQWLNDRFLSQESHPIHSTGLRVNHLLKPINEKDQIIYLNLYAIGNQIGNTDPMREFSREGISLATAYKTSEYLITQNTE